jgi:hypothetical protein
MDARKNNIPSEKIKNKDNPNSTLNQDFDINYQSLREELQNSTNTTLKNLDKFIEASSKKSNKRLYLELFRALVLDSAQTSESIFFLFEYIVDLRASMLLLSLEMEKANGKNTKEVKHIKDKIDILLNSPAVVEIGKILQKMQKVSEERKLQTDEKSVKEYLR